jgi:Lipid A 3-O-deacylase (PagL)
LRKAVLASLFAGLVCLSGWGQERGGLGGVESFGFSTTYSPNSSHIVIGLAQQRRTWTTGFEYTHLLHVNRSLRFDYEGSLLPLYLESDPTVIGTITTLAGRTFITPEPPVRVVFVDRGSVGTATAGGGTSAPIYAIYGRENTYAWSLAPVGVRVSAFPRSRIQPSLALDLGFVVSSRDIPVDDSDQFNYLFSFGPGVQVYSSSRSSVRLEYIYRHISNAHQGYQNPGVDQGVFRLTFSHHR